MKLGLAFTGTIVVCGSEGLTASATSANYEFRQAMISSTASITAASQNTWFSQTFPNSNWNQCLIKTSAIYTTCAGTSPFTHSKITLNLLGTCNNNFCPVEIDKTSPIPRLTFYVVAMTRGLVKACRPIDVEICGHQAVNKLLVSDP
jgi:hypothetical protein